MTPAYVRPGSLDDAIDALVRYGEEAALLAGGTSLVLLRRQGLIRPAAYIDLGAIPGLDRITRRTDGAIRMGAMATLSTIESDPLVRGTHPALGAAIHRVATVRIRNQATIGGNLAHADPSQDPPPMLIALDAEAEITGPRGRRTVPLDTFFLDVFETVLGPDEILVAVWIPPRGPGSAAAYVKYLPRTVDDYATVSVAARLDRQPSGSLDARIVLGSVGSTPIRVHEAETVIRTGDPEAPDIEAAAEAVRDRVDPVDDGRGSADYKREMAAVWTRRLLGRLLAHPEGVPS